MKLRQIFHIATDFNTFKFSMNFADYLTVNIVKVLTIKSCVLNRPNRTRSAQSMYTIAYQHAFDTFHQLTGPLVGWVEANKLAHACHAKFGKFGLSLVT